MSKDRARPFSRKHRRYWIPITGGMLVIGAINIGLGLSAYDAPGAPPERIIPTLPPAGTPAAGVERPPEGTISLAAIPTAVMRAFAISYPRHVPTAARKLAAPDEAVIYELSFAEGDAIRRVRFGEDGSER